MTDILEASREQAESLPERESAMPISDDRYEPFTIELSKPTEVQVGSAIGLNCPDDQTRLHKVLAVRDKGDYYEADVELLLKPVAPNKLSSRI